MALLPRLALLGLALVAAADARGDEPATRPGAALERAVETVRIAFADVAAASAALDRHDARGAQDALDRAAGGLRLVYTALPAGAVLGPLGRADARADLAPVLASVRSQAAWLDPEVVALVERAERARGKGQTVAADRHLARARLRLLGDLALLPVEDAYARVQAARGELRDGHTDQAGRLLGNLPLVMDRVLATLPLVPIRFHLREAAVALERGDSEEARALVERATTALERWTSTAPVRLASAIRPIVDRARRLQQRIADGEKPRPRDLRDLAERTRSLEPTS